MKLGRKHPSLVDLSRAACEGLSPALERHISTCSACAASLGSMVDAETLARELPTATPPARADETLASILAVSGERPLQRARRTPWRIVVPAIALAGAATAAVVPMVTHRPEPTPREPSLAADGPTFHGAVRAQPNARFTRESSAPDEVIRLHDGSIAVDVTDLHRGERFRVVVGDAEVEGHATSFEISAKADELAAVQVVHGRVDVRSAQRMPSVIIAGERWEAQPIADRDVVSAQASKPARVEPAPAVVPTYGQQPTAATLSTPSPPTNVVETSPAPARRSVDRPMAKLFDRGWQQLKAGNPAAAVKAFDEALATDPSDPLSEDISFWRGIALKRLSHIAEASQALEGFLERYPLSPRAGEASVVLGWMLLEAGKLDGAERQFGAARQDAVEAVRASAEKGLRAVAAARTR